MYSYLTALQHRQNGMSATHLRKLYCIYSVSTTQCIFPFTRPLQILCCTEKKCQTQPCVSLITYVHGMQPVTSFFPETHLFPSSEIPEVFHCEGGKILEQVVQRCWGSSIPGGIHIHGALSSLVQGNVLCPWHFGCNSMIIKVPSNTNHSDSSIQDTKKIICISKLAFTILKEGKIFF